MNTTHRAYYVIHNLNFRDLNKTRENYNIKSSNIVRSCNKTEICNIKRNVTKSGKTVVIQKGDNRDVIKRANDIVIHNNNSVDVKSGNIKVIHKVNSGDVRDNDMMIKNVNSKDIVKSDITVTKYWRLKIVLLFKIITQMVLHLLVVFMNVCDFKERKVYEVKDAVACSENENSAVDEIEFSDAFPKSRDYSKMLRSGRHKRKYIA